MTKEKFSELLAILGEIFDKSISTSLAKIYFDALKSFSDEMIKEAFNKASLTLKFFPKPVELIEIIQGDKNEKAITAWEKFYHAIGRVGPYRSVQFDDQAIHSTVELMGGWVDSGKWSVNEMKWKQKDFLAIYPVMAKKKNHPDHLGGISEMDNIKKGMLNDIPKPVFIGQRKELPKQKLELASNL